MFMQASASADLSPAGTPGLTSVSPAFPALGESPLAGGGGCDEEVDLLVLGAGAAGMTAALVAAIEGYRPLLCEKSRWVGGTAARSSGGIWVPGNHQAERCGMADSLAAARTYLAALLPFGNAPACEHYLAMGPEVVDYLEQHSEVRFQPFETHPDYHALEGAATGGRPLQPEAYDGRRLGREFERVAPPLPVAMTLGGMMVGRPDIPHLLKPLGSWASLRHVAGLLLRHASDRLGYSRGTRLLMGNALVARLLASLLQHQVPIRYDTTATTLLREDGAVVGAELAGPQGSRRIRARYGVVLATGGFSHGPAWRERLLKPRERQALSLAAEGNTGDGLSLAESAGASVDRADITQGAVWAPVSITQGRNGKELRYPHFFMDRPKPGFIAVNRQGRRFVNEAASYHDFVAGMLASDENLPAWLVCDSHALHRYGMGLVLPGGKRLRRYLRRGYVVQGDSLEELARRLEIDPAGLVRTVERHNRFAEAGEDEDFGKGASVFNRWHGDATVSPNPCLGRIDQPPYSAVRLWPADLATHAGVRADGNAQALEASGRPIPGLHVCGNDMLTPWHGEAPGPGVTLGPALVFGYLAARHALRGAQVASTGIGGHSS